MNTGIRYMMHILISLSFELVLKNEDNFPSILSDQYLQLLVQFSCNQILCLFLFFLIKYRLDWLFCHINYIVEFQIFIISLHLITLRLINYIDSLPWKKKRQKKKKVPSPSNTHHAKPSLMHIRNITDDCPLCHIQ